MENIFNYFMWKELSEVPGQLVINQQNFTQLSSLLMNQGKLDNIRQILLIANGSSYNASGVAKYYFEELAKIHTYIEYGNEIREGLQITPKNSLIIAVSQSGRSSDIVQAILNLKMEKSNVIMGLTNAMECPLVKLCDFHISINAGQENAIPATKTFSLQLYSLLQIALFISRLKASSIRKAKNIEKELIHIPINLKNTIEQTNLYLLFAEKLFRSDHIVILSRGINYPIAKEAALKFKESFYVNASGFSIGEFIHGHMAILDRRVSVLVLENNTDEILRSKLKKLRQNTDAFFYGITSSTGDKSIYDDFITIPQTQEELLSPLLFTTSLHMLAFMGAIIKKRNPDKPRNLKKFLT